MGNMVLTSTEQIALKLIKTDLLFVYTLTLKNKEKKINPTYFVSLSPYLGVVTSGIEQWSKKVGETKEFISKFNSQEKDYYEKLRGNVKLSNYDFKEYLDVLEIKYNEADDYFANACKPIAKLLNLYDIFGCFLINDQYCDNTILDSIYTPYHSYESGNEDYIINMSSFLGKLCAEYGVVNTQSLNLKDNMKNETKDYGGLITSPVKSRNFTDKFALFSILCSINFVIYGINEYIIDEVTTKFRFVYLQYYYISFLLTDINNHFQTNFIIDKSMVNENIRNSMAHYGLGSVLKPDEIDIHDEFGGLTQKFLNLNWIDTKNHIVLSLKDLSEQLKIYLKV